MEKADIRLVRLAELEIDPDHLDAYLALLCEEVEASVRMEPGVLALYATSVRGSPASVRMTEIYADQQAYDAHLMSPHFLKYKAMTAGMVLSLKLTDLDPLLLAAKGMG